MVTKIPKLRRFVLQNFPFIEQDFDALTDYELICKVVQYLNKVIDQTNLTTEQVEVLTNAFNELKDYVDNYFENLDVQGEINNKLEQMVEDGQLQEIISQYLNSTAVFGFDTVADMKQATNLINGSYAKTLGYHAKNDGGVSTYKIRTITNDDVVDEASIIAMADDTLVAELIPYNNQISLKQFGCYGDGTHDDTVNIQKAIDYFVANKGVKLISDKSTYLVSDTIEIDDDDEADYYLNKEIDFALATFVTSSNITVFQISATWLNLNIGNISKDGTKYSQGVGVELAGKVWHNTFNFKSIIGFQYGLKLMPAGGIMHNKINWTYFNNRINIYGDINNSYINENEFNGGNLGSDPADTTSYGIYIVNTAANPNHEFNGNIFYHTAFEIVAHPIHLEHCQFSTFRDFRFMERQITTDYITCVDCNNMLFESNETSYFNDPSYVTDDFTLDNADIGNWNANCNKYFINQGKQSLVESAGTSTCQKFTKINGITIYYDFNRKAGQDMYIEASSAQHVVNVTGNIPYTYFSCVLGAGNVEINLPQKYSYKNSIYDEIVINLIHQISPNEIVVKDYAGTTIFNSADYTYTRGMSINKKFIIKNTGQNNRYVVISC